jgi:hypothetical protein
MGILDDLRKGARDLAEEGKEFAETQGKDLLARSKQAIGERADDFKNQATKKVTGFLDEQKQKLTDKLKK